MNVRRWFRNVLRGPGRRRLGDEGLGGGVAEPVVLAPKQVRILSTGALVAVTGGSVVVLGIVALAGDATAVTSIGTLATTGLVALVALSGAKHD